MTFHVNDLMHYIHMRFFLIIFLDYYILYIVFTFIVFTFFIFILTFFYLFLEIS